MIIEHIPEDEEEKRDSASYAKLTRGAKTRVSIDYAEVLRRLEQ